MKAIKVKWISGWMALLVLIGVVFPSHAVFSENAPTATDSVYSVTDSVYPPILKLDGTNKVSALTNLSASITQNGKEITVDDKISHTEPVTVEISFGVPVEGDVDPVDPIRKGDVASFKLSTGFAVLNHTSFDLEFSGYKVGEIELVSDSATQEVTVNILFNGDDEVFDENSGINSVIGNFKAQLQYDASGDGGDEGDHEVMILDKTYTVNVPPAEIIYTSSKTGTADLANKLVTWEVKVGATQSGNPIDLKDYVFTDELAQVGEYIEGSFEVNGTPADPVVTGTEITHTFADNSVGEQIIRFQTTIPDEKYYAGGAQHVSNQAQLLNQQNEVVQTPSFQVSFTPKWIEKTGTANNEYNNGIYDPSNRTITWTITANQPGAELNNLTITDQLPEGLEWQSAKWTTGSAETPITAEPVNGVYVHPDSVVNQQVVLTIVTKVKETGPTTGPLTFRNTASVDWEGRTGTKPSASDEVGIGYSAITKSGDIDYSSRQVKWTINVDAKGQNIPDLKVYDLLVYGSSIDLNQVDGLPAGISANELIPRYHQKYVDPSASASGSADFDVIPIEQDGERVADLLVFSGLSTNTLSYNSLITNPDIYAGNKTSKVENTAMLYSGTTRLNYTTASVNYTSSLLAKELLKREAIADPIAGVNNKTTAAAEGFDYIDKSVIFRLSINADALDFSSVKNADAEVLGKVTVTDTLPAGWEFVDIEPGQSYLAFEGSKGSGASVNATGNPVTLPAADAAQVEGGTATFTFAALDQPYVILLKAKPTDVTLADYFDNNKDSLMTNQLNLSATNWAKGVSTEQRVSIHSQLVDKSNTVPQAGTLHWTVVYNPYQLQDVGETIEDILPAGLELRTDAQGNLLIDGNITAREMTLKPDGTLEEGSVIPLIAGTNVAYDNQNRVLSFALEDTSKAYRFTYLTDITGEPGEVNNKVRLLNGNVDTVVDAASYTINSADASATLQRNGWLEITKTGEAGALAGAEFSLFSEDGSTVIRKGITGANGKVRLKVIPDGKYVLKETVAPAGYTLDETEHEVTVSAAVAFVDGKTGTGSHLLNVANYVTGTAGNLKIAKNVAGTDGSLSKKFDFTITLDGATGTYSYTGAGGASSGTIQSGGTISLAHGESITITGLPKGTKYEVVEDDYSAEGYLTVGNGATGEIVADDTQTVTYTNTKDKPGSLVISKTVEGNGGDASKKFNFTVTLDGAPGTYSYTGTGGADSGTIQSGGTVLLAHGESITINGLPKGTKYNVVEDDYSAEGYTTVPNGASGEIVTEGTGSANFVNTREKPGSLTINKTVAGNAGDPSKKFNFTVTLDGAPDTYSYTGTGGADSGTIQSGGTVSLAHGESITINGLPKGTKYNVVEDDYSSEGYSTVASGASGEIVSGDTSSVTYVNTKDKPGSLIISKTVTGNSGSLSKKFNFTVTLDGAPGVYNYSGTGGVSGTIQSGGVISLAHGESITIEGLPKDTKYVVTEADYSMDGYKTTSIDGTGVIKTDEVQTAAFTNRRHYTYHPSRPGDSTPSRPSQPVDPSDPIENEQPGNPVEPGPDGPTVPGEIIDPTEDGGNNGSDPNTEIGESGLNNEKPDASDNENGDKLSSSSENAVQPGRGTPKTGDTTKHSLAWWGLGLSTMALLGLFCADYVLRRRKRV